MRRPSSSTTSKRHPPCGPARGRAPAPDARRVRRRAPAPAAGRPRRDHGELRHGEIAVQQHQGQHHKDLEHGHPSSHSSLGSARRHPLLERSYPLVERDQIWIPGNSVVEDPSQCRQVDLRPFEQPRRRHRVAHLESALDRSHGPLQRDQPLAEVRSGRCRSRGVCAPPRYRGFSMGAWAASGEVRGSTAALGRSALRSAWARSRRSWVASSCTLGSRGASIRRSCNLRCRFSRSKEDALGAAWTRGDTTRRPRCSSRTRASERSIARAGGSRHALTTTTVSSHPIGEPPCLPLMLEDQVSLRMRLTRVKGSTRVRGLCFQVSG